MSLLSRAPRVPVDKFADSSFRAGLGRIVLSKGVYDLTHYGHIEALWAAKSLGDTLVVAIASDESVRSRKGISRPILSIDERVGIITSLRMVDYVVEYDTSSAIDAIRAVRPDVFCATHFSYFDDQDADLLRSQGTTMVKLERPHTKSTSDIVNHIVHSYTAERGLSDAN